MDADYNLLTFQDHSNLPLSLSEAVTDEQFWTTERDEVVIDCGAIERVSSDDLNQLIRFYGEMRHESTQVRLTNVGDTLLRVFRMTRLDRLFLIDREISMTV